MRTKYTKEVLEPLVKESLTVSEVIRKLGFNVSGGMHSHITYMIKKYNIDTSHFLGKGSTKGKSFNHITKEQFIKERLVLNSKIKSTKIKVYLLKFGIKQNKCENIKCGITTWLDNDITIELHHINKNHTDNRLENLIMLCPNCHSVIHRKIKKVKKKEKKKYKPRKYPNRPDKKKWPSNEELAKMVWEKPCTQLAKELGVSDRAIGKRCKKYGIEKPSIGYWAKKKANKF